MVTTVDYLNHNCRQQGPTKVDALVKGPSDVCSGPAQVTRLGYFAAVPDLSLPKPVPNHSKDHQCADFVLWRSSLSSHAASGNHPLMIIDGPAEPKPAQLKFAGADSRNKA